MGYMVHDFNLLTKTARVGIALPLILRYLDNSQNYSIALRNKEITEYLIEALKLGEDQKQIISKTVSTCSKHPMTEGYTKPGEVIKLYGRMVQTRVWVKPA